MKHSQSQTLNITGKEKKGKKQRSARTTKRNFLTYQKIKTKEYLERMKLYRKANKYYKELSMRRLIRYRVRKLKEKKLKAGECDRAADAEGLVKVQQMQKSQLSEGMSQQVSDDPIRQMPIQQPEMEIEDESEEKQNIIVQQKATPRRRDPIDLTEEKKERAEREGSIMIESETPRRISKRLFMKQMGKTKSLQKMFKLIKRRYPDLSAQEIKTKFEFDDVVEEKKARKFEPILLISHEYLSKIEKPE